MNVPGVMGAIFMSLAGLALKFDHIGWIIGGGFAGMILDSVMGSLLQAGYKINGNWSGIPSKKGRDFPGKGFKWMTNGLVNLHSNLIITLFLAIIFLILWKGG